MRKIIVAITGASGTPIAVRMLERLRETKKVQIHLIISEGAKNVIKYESSADLEYICSLADYIYEETNMAAAISSGTFVTDGMIIAPCSMKTLSAVANAYDENLIVRAADVCLKECRKVVLIPREMPLSKAHLRNMLTAAEDGCVIIPPELSFYCGADSVEKQIDHIVGKAMMQFGLSFDEFRTWNGEK